MSQRIRFPRKETQAMKRMTLLRSASCFHRRQCWLLLLQLASPAACLPTAAACRLPAAGAGVRSVHDGPGFVWCSRAGRAVLAAAAMVIG